VSAPFRPVPTLALLAALAGGCAEGASTSTDRAEQLSVGESRTITLEALRFDVAGFEKRIDRGYILDLPADVRDRLWLLDLDLSNGPNTPQLIDRSLSAIRALDPAMLSGPARNMQRLLSMTPDNADLADTSIASLVDISPLLGIAPERVLADLFQIDADSTFLPDSVVSRTLVEQVIATHPNAQTRLGPRTDDNPDGIYPVTPGALPVTLTDLVSNFATMSSRFGPYDQGGAIHPGFLVGDTRADVIGDDFAIVVRANANALPFRGVDLGLGELASVSSVRSQIREMFDFDDPTFLRVEGLVSGQPKLSALTFRVVEAPAYYPGGNSPEPRGQGNSTAWTLPAWTLERVLLGAAQSAFQDLTSHVEYGAKDRSSPLFTADVADGFQTLFVEGGIGSPPAPSYVWDLLLEVAQRRLHDGDIPEGEADVEFTLENVSVGIDTKTIEQRVKDNLRQNPENMLALTERILDNTRGAADFYYDRQTDGDPAQRGDWLYFVAEGDMGLAADGNPRRAYGYTVQGFYSDAALSSKVSTTEVVGTDSSHEKVRLDDHPVLYLADDDGAVFKLTRGAKPSDSRITLTLERVR
jgi:hypothetical protein